MEEEKPHITPSFKFAYCLNVNLNKYYISIYDFDGKGTLKAFIKAIKSLKPRREKYPIYPSQTYKQYRRELRYTIKTNSGDCYFGFHGEKSVISQWDNQKLIDHLMELLLNAPDFEVVNEVKEPEPERPAPKPCGFRFVAEKEKGFIYIDIEEPFSQANFLEVLAQIPNLQISKSENIYSSWGPLESSDEITTSMGKVTINSIWEGLDVGYSISGEFPLMKVLYERLKISTIFFEE